MPVVLELRDDIAVIRFTSSGDELNVLNVETLSSLEAAVATVRRTQKVKGLILTGNSDCFVAGAAINEIKTILDGPPDKAKEVVRWAHSIFDQIEKLEIPSLALIEGLCLGGGYEVALACDWRVATPNPKTQIGLPEVKLGIFPGWGGTQRLPRVVGLRTAMDIILAGKTVSPEKAYSKGLVDAIAPLDGALEWAFTWLREKIEKNERNAKPIVASGKSWAERHKIGRMLMFWIAKRALTKKAGPNYPAPFLALQSLQNSSKFTLPNGLKKEAELVVDALYTPAARSLLHVYDLTQIAKQAQRRYPKVDTQVQHIGIVGAGLMGSGIAVAASRKNISVRMRDIEDKFISRGLGMAYKALQKAAKKRKMTKAEASMAMNRITGTTKARGFLDADLVVEAVAESPEIKDFVLADLEARIAKNCVIATNTSSLSATEMAKRLEHPERFVGLHFFNPAYQMPLVEVVPTEFTSATTMAKALAFVSQLGKTPVIVKDKPGFLVNRILLPYLTEALLVVQEGSDPLTVDRAMKQWGMPMGPLELIDQIGMEIAHHAANHLASAYEHMRIPDIMKEIKDAKLQKFYTKPNKINRQLVSLARKARRGIPRVFLTEKDIQQRLFKVIQEEARLCLEEEVAGSPEELDLAMIFGTGFPPFRGGPMYYAGTLNAKAEGQ